VDFLSGRNPDKTLPGVYFFFIIIIFFLCKLYLEDKTITEHTELLRILYLRLHFRYHTTYTI